MQSPTRYPRPSGSPQGEGCQHAHLSKVLPRFGLSTYTHTNAHRTSIEQQARRNTRTERVAAHSSSCKQCPPRVKCGPLHTLVPSRQAPQRTPQGPSQLHNRPNDLHSTEWCPKRPMTSNPIGE
eukprot:1796837-Pyramimonas_sp.AAC.1